MLWFFITEQPSDDIFISNDWSLLYLIPGRVPWICWRYLFFHAKLTNLPVSALLPVSWECGYKPVPKKSVNSWYTDKFKLGGLRRKKLLEMMGTVITWIGVIVSWMCIYIKTHEVVYFKYAQWIFPGGLVAKTLCSQCRGPNSILGQRTRSHML